MREVEEAAAVEETARLAARAGRCERWGMWHRLRERIGVCVCLVKKQA